MNIDPSPGGYAGRSPEGTAMLGGLTASHIARRAGLGAARRSARNAAVAATKESLQWVLKAS